MVCVPLLQAAGSCPQPLLRPALPPLASIPETHKPRCSPACPPLTPPLHPHPLPAPPPAPADDPKVARELQFFDRVKARLRNKEAYADFLKCLNMFAEDILAKQELVRWVGARWLG